MLTEAAERSRCRAATTIRLVEDEAALAALEPAWSRLWGACPDATPFQHPAWLLPWWRAFGGDRDLLTIAAWRGDELAGLAPLYILKDAQRRVLMPLGVGISDYLDPLLAPGMRAEVLGGIAAAVASRPRSFDRLDWPCLRDGEAMRRALATAGSATLLEEGEPCPVLVLPADARDLAAGPAGRRLAKLPYYRRRAERLGRFAVAVAGPEQVGPLIEALLSLHAARWRARGLPGVLADPAVQAFHRDAAPILAAHGLLRLMALTIDGRPVAMVHAMADRRRLHCYISGQDDGVAHPGLGAFAIGLAIERAVAEGLGELHFLRGREAYKYDWGAVDRPASVLHAGPAYGEAALRQE